MLKKHELADPNSCLNKADPNEPVFVLRAKDPLAAQTVRLWAAMAAGQHEEDKVFEAKAAADQMEKWRSDRTAKAAMPAESVLGMQQEQRKAVGRILGGAPYGNR